MLHRLLIVLLAVALPSAGPTASGALLDASVERSRAVAAHAAPGPAYSAPLPLPVEVLTPFDPPDQPWGSGHRGVDLAGRVGAPVRAAAAGEVVYAGTLAGRGVVSVQHADGIRTTYEPVESAVSAGAQVTAGQVLGTVAAGHASCAPAVCLHWGARTGPDVYLDPMLLVTGWRVRLLPWDGAPP